jgi:four helix bundle protein
VGNGKTGTSTKGFRDLRVWQSSVDLVEEVYRLTWEFPDREAYGLSSQMQRAAVSVPSNIAEGHVREHLREYLHHISISLGSLAELQTQAEIAARLGYVSRERAGGVVEDASTLSKQLYSLRNSLSRRLESARSLPQHPTPNT